MSRAGRPRIPEVGTWRRFKVVSKLLFYSCSSASAPSTPLTPFCPRCAAIILAHVLDFSLELRYECIHIRWERTDNFAHLVRLKPSMSVSMKVRKDRHTLFSNFLLERGASLLETTVHHLQPLEKLANLVLVTCQLKSEIKDGQ